MITIHTAKHAAVAAAVAFSLAACGGGGAGAGDDGGTNPPPPAAPPQTPTAATFSAELIALELEDSATSQPVSPTGLPVQGATLTRN